MPKHSLKKYFVSCSKVPKMQQVALTTDYHISRQLSSIESTLPSKTNVIMLDTSTLISLLIITVFIVQVFSLTITTNNIQTLVGRRSFQHSISSSSDNLVLKRQKRMWEDEYRWRNKFRRRNSLPYSTNDIFDSYASPNYGYGRYVDTILGNSLMRRNIV